MWPEPPQVWSEGGLLPYLPGLMLPEVRHYDLEIEWAGFGGALQLLFHMRGHVSEAAPWG